MNPFIPTTPPEDATIRAWWSAACNHAVDEALRALHEHAANVTALHRPVCLASGRCCNFKAHDHMLVVTGLEAAWTLRHAPRMVTAATARTAVAEGTCAFLDGSLCSIHEHRPTGCRTYFCDRGDGEWQSRLSESLHRTVRQLHDEHGIPYLCAEWSWLVHSLTAARESGVLPKDPLH